MSSKWKISRKTRTILNFHNRIPMIINSFQATSNRIHSEICTMSSSVPSNSFRDNQNNITYLSSENMALCEEPTGFSDDMDDNDNKHTAIKISNDNASKVNLLDELKFLCIKNQLTHVAIGDILKFINSNYDSSVPLDARTLLGTSNSKKTSEIEYIAGGQYYHYGLETSLSKILMKLREVDIAFYENLCSFGLYLKINVDGIPLYRSSTSQFWPISGQVCTVNNTTNFITQNPFLIGLYLGKQKPTECSDYMKRFIMDYDTLQSEGILFDDIRIKVNLKFFCCDAPARQLLKSIKSHTGYFSCERCVVKGSHDCTVTFPDLDCARRTDQSFKNKEQRKHHKGNSPLSFMNVGLVSQFVLDPMHLVYLGVVKKMLNIWIKGPLNFRLGPQQKQIISKKLEEFSEFFPCEINRKPRHIDELDRYKATEFRSFLLYTGPVALHGVIDINIYKNFLTLSSAIRLMSQEDISQNIDLAENIMNSFVKHFQSIYGNRHLVYNVHCLIHLIDDVKKYGPLSRFDAFPFENFIRILKKLLRSPNLPLQQVVNRYDEMQDVQLSKFNSPVTTYPFLKKAHFNGPTDCIDGDHFKLYKEIYFETFCIKLKDSDNGVIYGINRNIYRIVNIVSVDNSIYLLGQKFASKTNYFTYPIYSESLGIFKIKDLGHKIYRLSTNLIKAKCIILPLNDLESVCIPLVHII